MVTRYLPANKSKGIIPFQCSNSVRHQYLLRSIAYRLKEAGCRYCTEMNPLRLEFHHKDPKTKVANISDLIEINCNIEEFKEELNKCIVLCDNCHRKIHGR